jgi:replicative DNA helicase
MSMATVAPIDTERALVATVVNFPDVLDDITLSHEDFSSDTFGFVFRAVTYLREQGKDINVYAVIEKLAKRIEPQELLDICDVSCAVPSSAQDMARIIKAASLRRKLVGIGKQCLELAHDSEDVMAAYDAIERAVVEISTAADTGKGPVLFSDHLLEHWNVLDYRYKNRGNLTGITTGLTDLDAMLGGFQPKDFIIFAARPSMGKTALMLHMAQEASKVAIAVVFSLEMGIDQISDRLLASEGHVPLYNLRQGFIEDDHFARLSTATAVFDKRALYIDDMSAVTMGYIRTQLRKLRRKYPADTKLVVFLDYLQLVHQKGRSREEEVSLISRECKALAKDFNCTFVALSQLSRKTENKQDKRPMMSDLRDSGSLEQDADVVGLLYRDDYYNAETEKKNITEIIIAKQRNGPTGTAQVVFLKNVQRFVNLERQTREAK